MSGCVTAKGFRTGFLVTAAVMTAAIAVNWATFTSSDRAAGGVGSADEVQDRLNTLATSIWAIERKPLLGWGIGRFTSVNTDHHQQWSPSTPWERGFGIPSHFDIMGIAVELGVVGLILWVGILYLVIRRVAQAVRRLPEKGVYNRPLAWTALMCLIALITTGLTVDLRFFDFCNIIVWLLAGAVVERLERAEPQPGDRQRRGRRPCAHALGCSDMTEHRVLWISTSLTTRGGIATFVNGMRQTPLWTTWNVRHVATHQDGSVLAKAAILRGARTVLWELAVRPPEVMHIHMSSYGSFVRKSLMTWAGWLRRVPVVVHMHGSEFDVFFARCPRVVQIYISVTLNRSKVLIALGDTWAERLARIAPQASIVVVPNAVKPQGPTRQPTSREPITVLFLGNIGDRKGAFTLIDAWSRVLSDWEGPSSPGSCWRVTDRSNARHAASSSWD